MYSPFSSSSSAFRFAVPPPPTHTRFARRAEAVDHLRTHVYESRVHAARQLELKHPRSVHDFIFARGDLVLMRNKSVESALNRQVRLRYLGPYVVLAHNRGSAYIVCELDGVLLDRPIAAFRLVPYLAPRRIDLAWLDDDAYILVSTARLREMEAPHSQGDDDDARIGDEDLERDAPVR
ncbi:hypothetical protein VTO73DRAFT_8074 [Trametes versicolor]